MDERWKNQAEYHDQCWVARFKDGHNSGSHAIHYGIYDQHDRDPQDAKRQTNERILDAIFEFNVNGEPDKAGETGLNIIDLGCGVGGTAIHIAKVARDWGHPPGYWQITGIAGSHEQKNLATALAVQERVQDRCGFLVAAFHDLYDIPAASMHFAYAVESIVLAWDKREVFRQVKRVLVPGGMFMHIDGCRSDVNPKLEDGHTRSLSADQHSLDAVLKGFALPDLYETPVDTELVLAWTPDGIDDLLVQDITESVLPGIARSAEKARPMIDDSEPGSRWRDHLLACVAMHHLFVHDLMHYRITTVTKR